MYEHSHISQALWSIESWRCSTFQSRWIQRMALINECLHSQLHTSQLCSSVWLCWTFVSNDCVQKNGSTVHLHCSGNQYAPRCCCCCLTSVVSPHCIKKINWFLYTMRRAIVFMMTCCTKQAINYPTENKNDKIIWIVISIQPAPINLFRKLIVTVSHQSKNSTAILPAVL